MGNCFTTPTEETQSDDSCAIVKRLRQPSTTLRTAKPPKATIIVPLYIYPLSGAWDKLHAIIKDNPEIQFIVIINPYNGPGPEPLPEQDYVDAIPKLTIHNNVEVLGYVHVEYLERPLGEVFRDVQTYSEWSNYRADHPGLAIDGIFVDETPFAIDEGEEKYLRELMKFIKSCNGIGRTKKVIHNPGCVPASATSLELADVTVIFEHTYSIFKERQEHGMFDLATKFPATIPRFSSSDDEAEQKEKLRVRPVGTILRPSQILEQPQQAMLTSQTSHLIDPSRLGLMIHSVPSNISDDEVRETLMRVRGLASNIFITESDVQFYEQFSERLKDWVELLGKG